jgi:hypothetical protein
MSAPVDPERDLAGEATEMEAYRRRLRADISPEEASEECAEIEARAAWMEGADLDDGSDLLGDPDEYDYDVCDRCGGDGMDPWNDYLFECPQCQGRQQP